MTNAELEATQRIQVHWPRGGVPADTLGKINSCPKKYLEIFLAKAFSNFPALLGDKPPVGRFFMTVRRGAYKSVPELCQAVRSSGKKISDWSEQILKKIKLSPVETEVDLYEVSGEELGFTSSVPREDIYKRAFSFGFEKCLGEDGPLASRQCNDKKLRLIGMDPIISADGDPSVLCLDGDTYDLRLSAFYSHGGWSSCYVWIFVWPRRK